MVVPGVAVAGRWQVQRCKPGEPARAGGAWQEGVGDGDRRGAQRCVRQSAGPVHSARVVGAGYL